jgi:hypothetical protein
MKKIVAIGGSVIKTAREELIEVIKSDQVEMLIHNGGSIFHDFQKEINDLEGHSYPLDELLNSYEPNREASLEIWTWLQHYHLAPPGSVTRWCQEKDIPILMFTGLGCDFWQLFNDSWEIFAKVARDDFSQLCTRFQKKFHYVCMGSAVIHPEVFIKALAVAKPNVQFRADVVDFLDMYRPRTRVAKFGTYYQLTHKEYLKGLL